MPALHRPPSTVAIRPVRRWPALVLAAAGLGVPLACGADSVRDATVRELAVGTWRCTIESGEVVYAPLVVEIARGGTFAASFEVATSPSPVSSKLTGTWALEDGDLDWGFDEPATSERFRVPRFDDLTVDSTEFTLDSDGLFDPNPPMDTESALELPEVIEVEADGTDSVTFRQRGGDLWTCERQ
jgi:hypothetical protein